MSNRLLIATSWYSDATIHNRYQHRSKKVLEPNWLRDYWQPYVERFVVPDRYFCYVSNCDIMPYEDTFAASSNWEYVVGYDYAKKLDHRHDYHAALMLSLQYAFCNGMDWLNLEQDCLCYGLDKVLEWANNNINDKLIIYGWDPWWYRPGWAEQSLMYVPRLTIPAVLYIINNARVHENLAGCPEVNWHQLFCNSFISWPFGYGRCEVKDWSGEMFFKQQVTDREIDNFLGL